MLLTMPGTPFIYYGDEIGMHYLEGLPSKEGSFRNRTGTRTPMQWRRGRNAGFSTAPAAKLYLPVDSSPKAPTVAEQETDSTSLLHFTRGLLALRRKYPALGNVGKFKPIHARKNGFPFVYERFLGRKRFWIAINPTDKSLKTALPGFKSAKTIQAPGAKLSPGAGKSTLAMAPVSFGIFEINP
jgi:maltose alpha-D-glucosyltransferase/alpha-amylase